MSLDDLLGLLFLLFFIVIPALQGLSRRTQSPPPPPGFPMDLPGPEAEPVPQPRPKARPKPPKPRPVPPPPSSLPPGKQPLPPKPSPVHPKKEERSLERYPSLERTPLEVNFRETLIPEEPREKAPKKKLVATDGKSILKGVIWHEILKKPKGW